MGAQRKHVNDRAKNRQHYQNQVLRGLKESRVWLPQAAHERLDAEVSRRTARGERGVSRQSVLTDIVEAGLSPEQADRVELRNELAKARAELARLEERVQYARG